MSISLEKLPNEPIIILKCQGMITVETLQNAFLETQQLMSIHNLKQVYRISDMLEAEYPNFSEMRRLFDFIKRKPQGTSGDIQSKIFGTFVGNNMFLRSYTTFIRMITMNSYTIRHFITVNEALDYLRTDPKGLVKASGVRTFFSEEGN